MGDIESDKAGIQSSYIVAEKTCLTNIPMIILIISSQGLEGLINCG
jgi:hypothetical protein